ncbi:LexA family transcriptional regulator [Thalassovita sp.]|uniref:LexA family transcriptional regulator n=1 Tax=Thalassovita sp. TaxID=1979401 RepID=UPI002B277099|nr:LexA family transcriptional regulator [Thalassovita sp.]
MSEISHKLKELRALSGMTQDEFSAALKEKPSKIRDIESGRQRVNDQFISKLVEIFPVDLNWLFSVDSDRAPIGPTNRNKPLHGEVRIGDQEYSTIRTYDIDAAAGNGIVPASEEASREVAFSRSWLMQNGIAADLAGLVRVKGDSMAPTIPDGSHILVDFTGKADWSPPGVYVIRHEGAVVVKRLQIINRTGEKLVVLLSDNPLFQPIFIAPDSALDFQPIARVRAVLATL